MVNKINENEFANTISNGVTVVDFFATWCGPCKMLSPVIDELSEELGDRVAFYKADIDEATNLAEEFKIMSVPTVLVFKDGVKQKALVGYKPKDELLAEINNYL